MKNDKDENKVFINACRNAGLKVQSKENDRVVEGLIIVDARGNRYSVNTDAKLQRFGVVCADDIRTIRRRVSKQPLGLEVNKVSYPSDSRKYRVDKLSLVLKKQED